MLEKEKVQDLDLVWISEPRDTELGEGGCDVGEGLHSRFIWRSRIEVPDAWVLVGVEF